VLWHGGTRNSSGARRRQLHLSFTRRDRPQQMNQRQYLTPSLYDRLTPALRYIMDVE
jgi:ectoine hydroxylase-related dioxygenase (phytanoyl-CoA dioxygenase family)